MKLHAGSSALYCTLPVQTFLSVLKGQTERNRDSIYMYTSLNMTPYKVDGHYTLLYMYQLAKCILKIILLSTCIVHSRPPARSKYKSSFKIIIIIIWYLFQSRCLTLPYTYKDFPWYFNYAEEYGKRFTPDSQGADITGIHSFREGDQ